MAKSKVTHPKTATASKVLSSKSTGSKSRTSSKKALSHAKTAKTAVFGRLVKVKKSASGSKSSKGHSFTVLTVRDTVPPPPLLEEEDEQSG